MAPLPRTVTAGSGERVIGAPAVSRAVVPGLEPVHPLTPCGRGGAPPGDSTRPALSTGRTNAQTHDGWAMPMRPNGRLLARKRLGLTGVVEDGSRRP